MIFKSIIIVMLMFFVSGAFAKNTTTIPKIYTQADSYIASRPTESTMTAAHVLQNYNAIEERWLGKDNAHYNQSIIQSSKLFANADMLNSNPYNLESPITSIEFIRLHYQTPNPDGIQNVSGLLILPKTTQYKGIVLFFHSTIIGKLNVPSLKFDEYKAQMLAAVFATDGYIVACPDYIGLGDNYKVVHPYILYPEMNVVDGKNILLTSMKYLNTKQGKRFLGRNIPLFVSGYSEGALYALWFSQIYQKNLKFAKELNSADLTLQKTVAIDGAYNLTGVMFPFLLSNQVNESGNRFKIHTSLWGTLLKPSLLANVMVSYAYYNHQNLQELLNPDFFRMKCAIFPDSLCQLDDVSMPKNIGEFMVTPAKTFSLILKYFFAANFKSNANGTMYSVLNNAVDPLLKAGAIENNQDILHLATQASIAGWKSNTPITLISLTNDSLVPEANSADTYATMLKAGSTNVKYLKIDNSLLKSKSLFHTGVIDHASFELYALLIAAREFNETKKPILK